MARHFFHQGGKIITLEDQCCGTNGIGRGLVGHLLKNILPQQFGGAFVQFHEVGRHPGFQRKAAQQAGAKAVDGLNAQAARSFNGAGEQAAGAGKVGRVQRHHLSQFGKGGGQIGGGHHRP